MEEEIARATAESTTTETLAGKLIELFIDSENDACQFYFKEETIVEVMQEFYKEIVACPAPLLLKMEEISLVVEFHPDVADAGGELETVEVVEEYKMEEHEVDFDDEWLAKVLNLSQGKFGDTNNWF